MWLHHKIETNKKEKEKGVCHTVALPFTLKSRYLKAKRRNMKTQIFDHELNIISKKIL
jgi:hypothetical protein